MLSVGIAAVSPLIMMAVAWGAQKANARHTDEKLRELRDEMRDQKSELKASIGNFGQRLGSVEAEIRVLRALDEDRSRPYRTPAPVMVPRHNDPDDDR